MLSSRLDRQLPEHHLAEPFDDSDRRLVRPSRHRESDFPRARASRDGADPGQRFRDRALAEPRRRNAVRGLQARPFGRSTRSPRRFMSRRDAAPITPCFERRIIGDKASAQGAHRRKWPATSARAGWPTKCPTMRREEVVDIRGMAQADHSVRALRRRAAGLRRARVRPHRRRRSRLRPASRRACARRSIAPTSESATCSKFSARAVCSNRRCSSSLPITGWRRSASSSKPIPPCEPKRRRHPGRLRRADDLPARSAESRPSVPATCAASA